MTPENYAKWIAALRSGEYKQTDGQLAEPDKSGFCCLGVLCDISGVGEWKVPSEFDPRYYGLVDDRLIYIVDGDQNACSSGVLPYNMPSEWTPLGSIQGEGITMNDDGKSFAEIADMIERNI